MAKRLTREEKSQLLIKDLINKMFEIAGHDVTYDDIKDRKDAWYTDWTITLDQHNEWKEWGIKEIMKRFRMKRFLAEREMSMMGLMWGLKFSGDPFEQIDK